MLQHIIFLILPVLIYLIHVFIVNSLSMVAEIKDNSRVMILIITFFSLILNFILKYYHIPDLYSLIIFIIFYMIAFFTLFKLYILELLYASLLLNFYFITLHGLIQMIAVVITQQSMEEIILNPTSYWITLIISRTIFFCIILYSNYFIIKPFRGIRLEYTTSSLIQMNVSQLLLCLLIIFLKSEYNSLTNLALYPLTFLLIISSNFFVSKVLFLNFMNLASYKKGASYIKILEKHIASQKKHYQTLEEEIENYKMLDHDYHSILKILDKLLIHRSYDENKQLISEFVDEINKVVSFNKHYSNNKVLDAICSETEMICLEHNIDFTARVHFDEQFTPSEFDLIRVSNNLISNAIEANLKVEESKRFINIESKISDEWIVFSIHNAFHKDNNKSNHKKHGYGLKITREIIEKVGGILRIKSNIQTGIFSVKIFIRLQGES